MNTENSKKLKKPKPWKHTQPITPAQLKQMRDEFWDTAPHYGGQKGMLTVHAKLNRTNFCVGLCFMILATLVHFPVSGYWFYHLYFSMFS